MIFHTLHNHTVYFTFTIFLWIFIATGGDSNLQWILSASAVTTVRHDTIDTKNRWRNKKKIIRATIYASVLEWNVCVCGWSAIVKLSDLIYDLSNSSPMAGTMSIILKMNIDFVMPENWHQQNILSEFRAFQKRHSISKAFIFKAHFYACIYISILRVYTLKLHNLAYSCIIKLFLVKWHRTLCSIWIWPGKRTKNTYFKRPRHAKASSTQIIIHAEEKTY